MNTIAPRVLLGEIGLLFTIVHILKTLLSSIVCMCLIQTKCNVVSTLRRCPDRRKLEMSVLVQCPCCSSLSIYYSFSALWWLYCLCHRGVVAVSHSYWFSSTLQLAVLINCSVANKNANKCHSRRRINETGAEKDGWCTDRRYL